MQIITDKQGRKHHVTNERSGRCIDCSRRRTNYAAKNSNRETVRFNDGCGCYPQNFKSLESVDDVPTRQNESWAEYQERVHVSVIALTRGIV